MHISNPYIVKSIYVYICSKISNLTPTVLTYPRKGWLFTHQQRLQVYLAVSLAAVCDDSSPEVGSHNLDVEPRKTVPAVTPRVDMYQLVLTQRPMHPP